MTREHQGKIRVGVRSVSHMPVESARILLLRGLGLLDGPATLRATNSIESAAMSTIESLGFVQLDSINVVERAHHHILWTRLPAYRPAMLDALQRSGRVFEQWTHDASIIPTSWFPHWRHRFEGREMGSWVRLKLGKDGQRVLAEVRRRIEREGPLMSKDFESHGHKAGAWWDWKPARAALEHLWRTGELSIAARVNFHKVYDLTERVLPNVREMPTPDRDEHEAWACRTALDRLGVATPREVAQFWNAIDATRAAAWCTRARREGEIERVMVEAHDGSAPREAYAVRDWRERAARAREGAGREGAGLRLLSPFDPLVRDRARCRRLFGFDYTFEAFVPERKRKYGYYVLPILDGDRLVGRLDPKLDRERSRLAIRGVWWEPGARATKTLQRRLDDAVGRYAGFVGAARVE